MTRNQSTHPLVALCKKRHCVSVHVTGPCHLPSVHFVQHGANPIPGVPLLQSSVKCRESVLIGLQSDRLHLLKQLQCLATTRANGSDLGGSGGLQPSVTRHTTSAARLVKGSTKRANSTLVRVPTYPLFSDPSTGTGPIIRNSENKKL